MISNGDVKKKQDCELTAGKRWISRYGEAYQYLKTDPSEGRFVFPRAVLPTATEAGYHFIFTCKDSTHPGLKETVDNSEGGEVSHREWNGRYHLMYTYRWVNEVPIRYEEKEEDTFAVNYLVMF
jgi:hypothetical protein